MVALNPFENKEALQLIQLKGEVIFRSKQMQVDFNLRDVNHSIQDSFAASTIATRPGQRRDELWKNTCFELFWSEQGSERYWELNLASNGDWNCYSFDSYRSNAPIEDKSVVLETFSSGRGNLSCTLKHPFQARHWQVSFCAVLKLATEGLESVHYFSSNHSASKPDFHLRKSFSIAREVV